jgi:hypothetical protein
MIEVFFKSELITLEYNSHQTSGIAVYAEQFLSWFKTKMDIQAIAGIQHFIVGFI